MKRFIAVFLLLFWFKMMHGQINTDPNLSPTPEDSLPSYNSLPGNEKAKVDRLRNATYFSETVSTFTPLSKTSFWLNKRFTGNSFTDRKNSIIDAYINPYVQISSDRWFINTRKNRWMFSVYFNPNFEVRIFRNDEQKGDKSEPVRTPSFRPGGEIFITNQRWFSRHNSHNFAISYKGYHHSNGQDGIEINQVDRLWGHAGYYNTYNGNFFENFHSELYFNAYTHSNNNRNFFHYKIGYSLAHGVAYSMKAYNLYGTNAVNILSTLVHAPQHRFRIRKAGGDWQPITKLYNVEKFRLEFFLSVITNKMNTGPVTELRPAGITQRLNTHLTFHFRIPGFADAGLFAEAGYYGHDTYNVYFQRSAWFIKTGISFGKFVYYRKSDDLK